MARTPSTMLPLGTQAPDFTLPEPLTSLNRTFSVEAAGKPVLVMFLSNHCPFVKLLKSELAKVAQQLILKGIHVMAVGSNDADAYPDDAPAKMAMDACAFEYPFVYVYDATQEVAKAYQAACTPDFFLFDAQHRLFYRGQFDDARPGNGIAPSGKDVLSAAEALLDGKTPPEVQRPSLGCNIKWKPGNEPDYFTFKQ